MSDHSPVLKDPRTRAALCDLAEKQKAAIDVAGEVCQCANCVQARAKKEISQCDKSRVLEYLPNRIIGQMPGHVQPELSASYMNSKYGKNWR
jgi:hypothetical protein